MQITFYLNKENFIELYEWLKKECPNIQYYDNNKNDLVDEIELYNSLTGHTGQIILTDEHSVLSSKIFDNNYDFLEKKYPFIWQNGIELSFGYSENKVYNFDFTNFNPYDKSNSEKFYRCRLYIDSFYLASNEFYIKIYQKICRKIRKNSIKLNGKYVKDYLYGQVI